MTTAEIIKIPLDSSDFSKFAELWEKYQGELKKQPEMWKKVAQAQHASTSELEKQAKNLQAQNELAHTNKSHDDLQFKRLGQSEQLWRQISLHGTSLFSNVLGVSLQFMKWGGLGLKALGIGVGAVAGAYAYQDKIANTVAGQRQVAKGFGVNIGQVSAFETAFGRVTDPLSLLASVTGMETDVTKRTAWYALMRGLPMSGNTATDALAFLNAERKFAQRTPVGLLGPLAQAYGLPASAEDLLRLRSTGGAEWMQMQGIYTKTAAAANIPDATALAAQNFATKIKGDLQQISSVWHQDAIKMMPLMGRLADGFTAFAVRFLQHPLAQGAGVAVGIPSSTMANMIAGYTSREDFLAHPTLSKFNALAGESDRVFGLPAGTLEMIKRRESGNLLSNVPASRAGALGVMQLMTGTAQSLGVNPNDPLQSLWGAGTLMNQLMREFGNNLAEAMAAYNWGAGNVQKDISRWGVDWQRHLPAETRQYISGVPSGNVGFNGFAAGTIRIENNTGGNVIVSLNGLACADVGR